MSPALPPADLPLVTTADLFAWSILVPLAVLSLLTARELRVGHIEAGQRYAAAANAVCIAGALGIVAWAALAAWSTP